ncbi:MAG: hypothetical protein K6A05_01235 [Lachnospiraceae bacterium]|nr:hypothetical protein [Lachnospiraceae bacterium]
MEKLQEIIDYFTMTYSAPELIRMGIVFAVFCIISWTLLFKVGTFNKGKQKLRDAKKQGRKITAHLDDRSSGWERPVEIGPIKLRLIRYRYTMPGTQELRHYYYRARQKGSLGRMITLYYDEKGWVFYNENDAWILGPVFKLIGILIPFGMFFLFKLVVGW